MATTTEKPAEKKELPEVIGIRTEEFAPLLLKWRNKNRKVPWAELLRSALKDSSELKELAGKRDAHILNN